MTTQIIETTGIDGADDRPRRVVGYIKVNLNGETKSGALAVQENEIRDYCHAKKWELSDLYVDEVCSTGGEDSETRPEYLRMMADVENERFDIVVTYSFDRMSRDLFDMFRTIKTFRDYNVSFVAIREGLDFSGPMGPVLMALFSSLAEMQSEAISHQAKKNII